MVQLLESDIRSKEVLDWRGVHLFHAMGSSCSQKVRIFLNLKQIDWTSHLIDLPAKENMSDFYLGVNPRGLVPTLVHNGQVHIESNDILLYLEQAFPEPSLIPVGSRAQVASLLHHEDELHMDLRRLTFRFMLPLKESPKSNEDLDSFERRTPGKVHGEADAAIQHEIDFWRKFGQVGVPDDEARASVQVFFDEFSQLNETLSRQDYLLVEELTLLDVAWFVYVNRLQWCGYPVTRLHPALGRWKAALEAKPEFASEIQLPPAMAQAINAKQAEEASRHQDLVSIGGL